MNDERLLIRAVCESPAEDTPRLMLADWYEENGQPERAEFIRLQILLHNTSFIRAGGIHARWPEPWVSRIKRADELVRAHGREWGGAATAQKPKCAPHLFGDWFRRGFVWRVEFGSGRFFRDAELVFRSHPVERVTLEGRYPQHEFMDNARPQWVRRDDGRGLFRPHEVPPCIYDRLHEPDSGWKYTSEAIDALSVALVGYGRELAGLSTELERSAA